MIILFILLQKSYIKNKGHLYYFHLFWGISIILLSVLISTFINDFTGSLPFISNYVNQANRINYYFNIFNGMINESLIAPISGIGYVYFPAFPFFVFYNF